MKLGDTRVFDDHDIKIVKSFPFHVGCCIISIVNIICRKCKYETKFLFIYLFTHVIL